MFSNNELAEAIMEKIILESSDFVLVWNHMVKVNKVYHGEEINLLQMEKIQHEMEFREIDYDAGIPE